MLKDFKIYNIIAQNFFMAIVSDGIFVFGSIDVQQIFVSLVAAR